MEINWGKSLVAKLSNCLSSRNKLAKTKKKKKKSRLKKLTTNYKKL